MSEHINQYMIELEVAAAEYAKAVATARQNYQERSRTPSSEKTDKEKQSADNPFNAGAFYDSVRHSLFGGTLDQGQVDGMGIIGQACSIAELDPALEQSAYVLATVFHETARTMQPIEEYGGWNTRYAPWFGRGYVQLTWEENYKKQQDKLHAIPQVHEYSVPYQVHDDWNNALHPTTSAIITVGGMRDGDFTGKALNDYIQPGSIDYINARRIVNGTDRAEQIAGYAALFEQAFRTGLAS
ncbi:MAG: hypothetical protein ACR2OR_03300 [Hyphomicrobiales bacterium]